MAEAENAEPASDTGSTSILLRDVMIERANHPRSADIHIPIRDGSSLSLRRRRTPWSNLLSASTRNHGEQIRRGFTTASAES